MPATTIHSLYLDGLTPHKVHIEVDITRGLPGTHIVGLADAAINESRDRIRSAITNSGFAFPTGKVIVNLAPAHKKKHGSAFDVPIALGILIASGQLSVEHLNSYLFFGELSLNGDIRPTTGSLLLAHEAKKRNLCALFPEGNRRMVTRFVRDDLYFTKTLRDCCKYLEKPRKRCYLAEFAPREQKAGQDFQDVAGQELAKRALTIAAAGGHNVLLFGPPGSGKSLLAKCFASILPPPNKEELFEIACIESLEGAGEAPSLARPFRSPHHTASTSAIVGGGSTPKPGELTRAHRGVLFLDELPEFSRKTLESLRQPLEDGIVSISRAEHKAVFPAKAQIIAAMNPCPCGYLTDPNRICTCSGFAVKRYLGKLSGPLLDRFDILIEVPRLNLKALHNRENRVCSNDLRSEVTDARSMKKVELPSSVRSEFIPIAETKNISGRGFHRLENVAKTIARLAGKNKVELEHLLEALQFRVDFSAYTQADF
jgi:magnesium chelatase family protein